MAASFEHAKTEVATYHFYAAEAPPFGSAAPDSVAESRAEDNLFNKDGESGYGCSQVVPCNRSPNEKLTSETQPDAPFQQTVGAGRVHF